MESAKEKSKSREGRSEYSSGNAEKG